MGLNEGEMNMSEQVKTLPSREQVPEELTWDLSSLFEDDQAFEKAYQAVDKGLDKVADYKGTLAQGPDQLLEALEYMLDLSRQLENVYVYSHLKNDQDTSNATYQSMHDRSSMLATKAGQAFSWFEPELLQISDQKLNDFMAENEDLKPYRHYLEDITRGRNHVLSEEAEHLLAGASQIFGASAETFSILNNADLEFPVVQNEEGEDVRLSHGLYGQLMESKDRSVRKQAFEALYSVYDQFQNTLASTLQGNVRSQNYSAQVRRYASARQAALDKNRIPESVYDNLVEVVNEKLALFHRYIDLRKKMLDLDDLHMYDMYAPLVEDDTFKFTYEEAQEVTLKALAPLGEDYQGVLKSAFHEGWIDVVENKGKRSGAYSSGSYDSKPYILLNWYDSLNELYTLVHELGHSMHSYLAQSNQDYVYGSYSIFLAEIASTTNENLLTEYLLEKADQPKQKISILNQYLDGFKGTVFRQTQFAEFEHFIHEEAAAGTPLTADYLNQYYADLNQRYYGSNVAQDEEIRLEWSRIPHFYYNYYVYQYATGFAAASALAERIIQKEEGALEAYLNYLKAGSSDYPVEVMKKAGVDMTEKDYLYQAMAVFERRLKELEDLLAE